MFISLFLCTFFADIFEKNVFDFRESIMGDGYWGFPKRSCNSKTRNEVYWQHAWKRGKYSSTLI